MTARIQEGASEATPTGPDTLLSDAELPRALGRTWQQVMAKSKQDSEARRRRVLAQPDLAGRLTQLPLKLDYPGRWSGWIPPRTLPEECCVHCAGPDPRPACRGVPHRARRNESPARRQLVEIAAEALRRESGQ